MSWWKRAPLVLVAPRPAFFALRDESVEDAEDRQEPLAALIALAGISVVLISPTFRRMLNDPQVSLVLVPALAFISGALYAVAVWWLGGGCCSARGADSAVSAPTAVLVMSSSSHRRRSRCR